MKLRKYDIALADLEKTRGKEQFGIRPVVILQTNALNEIETGSYVIAPMSTRLRTWGTAVTVEKSGGNGLDKDSRIELSQIATIDEERIKKYLGTLDEKYRGELREKIERLFDLYDEF